MKLFPALLPSAGPPVVGEAGYDLHALAHRLQAALPEATTSDLIPAVKRRETVRVVLTSSEEDLLLAPWQDVVFPELGRLGQWEDLHLARALPSSTTECVEPPKDGGHVPLVTSSAGGSVPTTCWWRGKVSSWLCSWIRRYSSR